MNLAKVKNYAPQARREFIKAVTDRAAYYGITATKVEPITEQGDIAVIGGRTYRRAVAAQRSALDDRIKRDGFAQTMEAMAYTWFNRFVAIRYMEIHGYLDHGYRVLSNPDASNTVPEILQHAEHVDMPGLDKRKVVDLKLAGNKDDELYRLLLLAQCNALHAAMPFLFERIDDESELLLPDNLLHSGSLIRTLVAESPEEDWQEVEVLGWLYQFYISERKDEVMGRKSAVPTEDIPAVTQLFTPHWIVRYLVENSLGRLWLLNRPGSKLRAHMPYYIEGEHEIDFLKVAKPEEIRVCDPACGSGHLLTYAFDLFTLIYEEEGYSPAEIPQKILRHNLHGLEICPRAAQLAELALVFKAREKSRRFFQPEHLVRPAIIELRDVRFAENELRDYINALRIGDLFNQLLLKLLHQFEEAKIFGSLIQPCLDERAIANARRVIEAKDLGGQLFLRETHLKVLRVLEQAEVLTQRYHVVVANPPYMGVRQMNGIMKVFGSDKYPSSKSDLFSMFIERGLTLTTESGHVGLVTMHSWMFLSSFEQLRAHLVLRTAIVSMAHLGAHGFDSIGGEVVQTTAFITSNKASPRHLGEYHRLTDATGEAEKSALLISAIADPSSLIHFSLATSEFSRLPGKIIAYWMTKRMRTIFAENPPLSSISKPRQGATTSDNNRFLRVWHEVSLARMNFDSQNLGEAKQSLATWFPYNKGGYSRKWSGNQDYVINYRNDGEDIKAFHDILNLTSPGGRLKNQEYYFKPCVSWSKVAGGNFAVRYFPEGFIFDVAGSAVFFDTKEASMYFCGLLNSGVIATFLRTISPTINFEAEHLAVLPVPESYRNGERILPIASLVGECIALAHADWDNFETSWDFRDQPLLRPELKGATLEATWRNWEAQSTAAIRRMQELETENNRLFIAAYGLDGELQPEVPEEQITLARADARRDMAAFLSYAIGCMMGRYSLDQPGLILADAGDTVQQYFSKSGRTRDQLGFMPDDDGIIPVLDTEWFQDDVVARTHAFLRATFGNATFEQNLRFIEESLGKDLRGYFLSEFYKNHLGGERAYGYKKRPIYWLFSSGKQQAFQALVYLHRYHEGTLARMRTEYVIPLQGKMAARIDQLADDIEKSTSTSQRKKLEKERDKLLKQQTELQTFDEKLRHCADQKITLDLDDGVKVNYAKFGDLLAEVKAVTGAKEED